MAGSLSQSDLADEHTDRRRATPSASWITFIQNTIAKVLSVIVSFLVAMFCAP